MYDAIVVGARCAGSPTAMLLARRGHRVLLVDRARFPSDTLSTHFLHPPSLARLRRWGVLGEATAGCPVWRGVRLDLGEAVLAGIPPAQDGIDASCAPRRTILDAALLDAAVRAGAEFREGFAVQDLLVEDGAVVGVRGAAAGGRTVTERARLVIGADGLGSRVADLVAAARYVDRPARTCAYYGYWSGAGVDTARLWIRPGSAVIAFPTAGGLTTVYVAWPRDRFDAVRGDLEHAFPEAVEGTAPELAEQLRHGRREEPLRGSGRLPNHLRASHGPGWALVGDAGHHQDPLLARGIGNALLAAELLAEAADDGLAGRRPMEVALADYQARRDAAVMPAFELGYEMAALRPPPEPMGAFIAALAGDPAATSRFLGVLADTVPVAEVLAPEPMREVIARATGVAQASAAASPVREATRSFA